MAESINLKFGTLVDNQWEVGTKTGDGTYCSVYKCVKKDRKDELYALKVESLEDKFAFLRKEAIILSELTTQKRDHHFCKIKTRGRMDNFFFVVMTLVGRTLHDLRMERPMRKFSHGTTISVGIKCLEALEALHSVEYMYREVSPSNFAIGLPEFNELRKIYLLDLGGARKFVSEDGSYKRQKKMFGFREKSINYAPLAFHEDRDLYRKDDIESLIYMLAEFILGSLPWSKHTNQADIGRSKKQVRTTDRGMKKLFGSTPRKFKEILKLADDCKPFEEPNYAQAYRLLRVAMSNTSAKEYPYDWEGTQDSYDPDEELESVFSRKTKKSVKLGKKKTVSTTSTDKRSSVSSDKDLSDKQSTKPQKNKLSINRSSRK